MVGRWMARHYGGLRLGVIGAARAGISALGVSGRTSLRLTQIGEGLSPGRMPRPYSLPLIAVGIQICSSPFLVSILGLRRTDQCCHEICLTPASAEHHPELLDLGSGKLGPLFEASDGPAVAEGPECLR